MHFLLVPFVTMEPTVDKEIVCVLFVLLSAAIPVCLLPDHVILRDINQVFVEIIA